MSVRSIEAEVSIKSGVQAECTIGREVEVRDDVNLESLTVTANGNYAPAEGIDGYSDVTVAVPKRVPHIKGLIVIANGTYTADGDGYNPVTVSVPERIPVTESLSVTENGTYDPIDGIDGYRSVTVAVPPTIPDIEPLTVTENGEYIASGDGFNPVIVNVANVKKIKTGIYIPSETYSSNRDCEIVSLDDIGFTPTRFVLRPSNIIDVIRTQYAMMLAYYDAIPEFEEEITKVRMYMTSVTAYAETGSWTSPSVGRLLYLSNGVVMYRTSDKCWLLKDVEYTWVATK